MAPRHVRITSSTALELIIVVAMVALVHGRPKPTHRNAPVVFPVMCTPVEVLPDPMTRVTSVALRVVSRDVVLDTSSSKPAISFHSRVFEWSAAVGTAPLRGSSRATCNGFIPGPTIVVAPGGVLNVTLTNELGPNDRSRSALYDNNVSDDVFLSGVAGPVNKDYANNHWHHVNLTNLHTHGLHVNPNIDDPFRKIFAGNVGHYWISLPPAHPTGTYWYHTHIHGATALHLMGGLFGMILVEPDDVIAARSAAPDGALPHPPQSGSLRLRLLRAGIMVQPVAVHLLKFAKKGSPSPFAGSSFADLDERLHSLLATNASVSGVDILAVNGQVQPTLTVTDGVPVLLNVLFASSFGEMHLQFPESCETSVVAADGIDYAQPRRPLPSLPDDATATDTSERGNKKRGASAKSKRVDGGGRLKFVSATRFDIVLTCHLPSGHDTSLSHSLNVIDLGVLEYVRNNEEYAEKARDVLGEVPSVVFRVQVDAASHKRGAAAANPDAVTATLLQSILHKEDAVVAPQQVHQLEDLRGQAVNKTWDISMDQRSQIQFNKQHLAKELPAQLAASGRRPAPLPVPTVYAIGSGSNCDPTREALDIDGDARSDCSFQPFQGKRGSRDISLYKGFVVPHNGVVESRWFGDPSDAKPHPLHFHVNHFQIIDYVPRTAAKNHKNISGTNTSAAMLLEEYGIRAGDWRDTIPVLPGMTVVRWRAARYHGEVVYHCHTTSHEDLGMMGSYFILPPPPSTDRTTAFLDNESSLASAPRRSLPKVSMDDYSHSATLRHWWTPLVFALIAVTGFLWYWLRQVAMRGLRVPRRRAPDNV